MPSANILRPSGRVSLSIALAWALIASGCSRDAEVLAFVVDFDNFTAQIVKTVKESKSPLAGVDEAQKYLDANKADLRKKLDAIKQIRNFQMTEDTRKKVEASFAKNAEAVGSLAVGSVAQAAADPKFREKLEKLLRDYQAVLATEPAKP